MLTAERHDDIVAFSLKGIPLTVAAQATGISARCAELWMARGEKDWDAWDQDVEPEVGTHAAFFREVRRAAAIWEIERFGVALSGDMPGVGNGPGKSAQWALERLKGKRYQPKIQLQVESEMAVVLEVLAVILPTEQYAAVLGALGDLDDDGLPRVLSAPVDAPDDGVQVTH